jgi:hypothetical protein
VFGKNVIMNNLEILEAKIESKLQKLCLGDVLWQLRHFPKKLSPFVISGTAMFAIRFCHASNVNKKIAKVDISHILGLVSTYLLEDPIGFDQEIQDNFIEDNPVFTLLRMINSQFSHELSAYGNYARAIYLFHELPKNNTDISSKKFDFEKSFFAINNCSAIDFLDCAMFIYVSASNDFAFNLDSYLLRARKQGLTPLKSSLFQTTVLTLSCDKWKFIQQYEKAKARDRRLAAYNLNPLFIYPIVRPCQNKQFSTRDKEYYTVPNSSLLSYRMCSGIFYQMFNQYKDAFSTYFGFVFESYVGEVLRQSVAGTSLLYSESDIRTTYPEKMGKVPDWIFITDSCAVFIECKATRFTRPALTEGTEDAVNYSLSQTIKGLNQLNEFTKACQAKKTGLEAIHNCQEFRPLLITFEQLFLVNSELFKKHINGILQAKGIVDLQWIILSVQELEVLQPHLKSGLDFCTLLADIQTKNFNDVIEHLTQVNGITYKDSFSYKKVEEFFQRINFSDKEQNTVSFD